MSLSTPPARKGAHAIVIGGSMAGLLAARVLADHFARVTILERDELPEGDAERAGVPQGRHAHALLLGGRRQIEAFFPGIEAELSAAGAPLLDQGLDATALFKGGYAPRVKTGLLIHSLSRALVESRVRRRVLQIPNVTVRERTEVIGLLSDASGKTVVGVRLRARGGANAPEDALLANLVVEASGRASRMPDWLVELGYPAPEASVVDASVGYASRWYRRPGLAAGERRAIWIVTRPPHGTRGGLLVPVEGDRWVVTLFGAAGDYPPTDEAEFLTFTHALPGPELYEALKDAEPLGPIFGYRRTENRMRHYDRLTARPEGLVVMGDAYCALNPTYGQGMSVAAFGAAALDEELRRHAGADMAGFAARFQRRLAKAAAPAWLLATAEDARWPGARGATLDGSTRLMHWYTDQIFAMIPHRPDIFQAFLRVQHMLEPAGALFRPRVLAAVLGHALWGRTRAADGRAERAAPVYGD